jgi:unspecific monooxygenase
VSKAFTPRSVQKMRPRIQQIVDELLDGIGGRRSSTSCLSWPGRYR